MHVVILPQGVLAKFMWTSQDGRMGHDGRRSRCFGRRTEAGSTGDAAGDTMEATTGVARTAGRCSMTIKDVIAFPLLRPEGGGRAAGGEEEE